MPLAAGTKLGPYEIVAPLGAGGMGEVWRARDPRLGREIAIKVLPADVAASPERLARFEREARTVAALNHPNVITLHSIEQDGAVRFLTMEMVEGSTLDRIVEAGGLPVARVLALAIPMADALGAAHARGVVHRDLKPSNVMVTREGRVKLLDFGLARHAEDGSLDATQAATVAAPLSSPGQVVGTVPYMSPEQLRGDSLDARSDLFSLGILVFELATGRRPFAGSSSAEVTSAILRDPPPPARAVRADLPAELERILSRCLEKDPERRVQTAKDVRNELELLRRTLESGGLPAPAPAARAADDVPSIAVLPFENRSRDEEDEYFADGLADELLNVLAKIRGVRVTARTSSRQFRGSSEGPAAIGAKLRVATLLEGSVRKSGNRVRIAVQLVNAADGFHLWSETYDRTLDDIFAVQDDIAQAVVKELRARLFGELPDAKASGEVRAEVAAAAEGRGHDTEAHRLYLQGRYFVDRLGRADSARGLELLRRAVALEPEHALAWAAIARGESAIVNYDATPKGEGYARFKEAAERALALQPRLVEAHVALAMHRLWQEMDLAGADALCRSALETAPDDAMVLALAALVAALCGRVDEGAALAQRASELDPLNVAALANLGRIEFMRGRREAALEAFSAALAISPDAQPVRALLGILLGHMGRTDAGLAEVEREVLPWARRYGRAHILAFAGREREARQALAELVEQHGAHTAYQIAVVHGLLGDVDEAFTWLERGRADRDNGVLFSGAHARHYFGALLGDPRWPRFLQSLGLDPAA